jgi:hypothetical protein
MSRLPSLLGLVFLLATCGGDDNDDNGKLCKDSTACRTPLTCIGGGTLAGTCAAACRDSVECERDIGAGYVCTDRVCVKSCTKDSDCPGTLDCEPVTMSCR